MREVRGNIFSQDCDAICITTNGITKIDGTAVMGKGIALQAKQRYPGIEIEHGDLIRKNGNITQVLLDNTKPVIVALPTKHHWRDKSDINLIENSIKQLVQITNRKGWNRVYTVPPGCSTGSLDWKREVKPRIEEYLDDRFYVITP